MNSEDKRTNRIANKKKKVRFNFFLVILMSILLAIALFIGIRYLIFQNRIDTFKYFAGLIIILAFEVAFFIDWLNSKKMPELLYPETK